MANKYIAWDPTNKRNKEIEGQVTTAGAGDAGKIIALDAGGLIDPSLLPAGIGSATFTAIASEALSAGDFVNIHDVAGVISVRKADANNNRKADAYVLANVLLAGAATCYYGDVNNQLSALTLATDYFLSETAGAVTDTPPTASGSLVQRLGVTRSATELVVDIQEVPLELA